VHYIEGVDRHQQQLLPGCVEDYVGPEAAVRVIDAFVGQLPLEKLGFDAEVAATGRPPYDPADLLKLYVYGYVHRIRSSRRLEAECYRNLEVIWLLGGLRPDHWTVAAFRREHKSGFKQVLREFNLTCRQLGLFAAELVAIDGAKFKAVNNRNEYFTLKQLKELVPQIDAKIEQYVEQLEEADAATANVPVAPTAAQLREKLARLKERRDQYAGLRDELQAQQKTEVALTDPDSRGQKKVGVGYNVQIAVDTKHDLIVAEAVEQDANDLGQLASMAQAAQAAIGVSTVVADAGYHEGGELAKCEAAKITTYVPAPRTTSGTTRNGAQVYAKEAFTYDETKDEYTCPADQRLTRTGSGLRRGKSSNYYANPQACAACPLRAQCTTAQYRRISRGEHETAVERQAKRLEGKRSLMRERSATVEHVFGTLRLWGHDSFLCRGLAMVRAEFCLSALAYNLRRAITVLGVERLIAALQAA
jgi:transposase